MKKICNTLQGLKAAMMMVGAQSAFAVMVVLYKLAANDGMSLRIISAYRFIFALPVMVPLALLVETRYRPKLTRTILFQAFLCGLFGGSLSQNLYIESMALTSGTFVSAMTNLIPVTTFIFAVALRMERLAFGTMAGKAKVFGTLIGIGGAMLLIFYQGVEITIWQTHFNLIKNHGGHGASSSSPKSSANFLLGALLSFATCITFTVWLIIQAKMSKKYPFPYSSTALMCVMGAMQSVVYALCTEKDKSQWKLGWNIRLLTVAFAGIVVSGLTCVMVTWCLRVKGPLYASIFNPLVLVLVALAESLFLEAKLHLGSILGAVLIVLGLYVVLWGKGKEMAMEMKMNDKSAAERKQLPASTTSSPQDESIEINVGSSNDNSTSNNNNRNNATEASTESR